MICIKFGGTDNEQKSKNAQEAHVQTGNEFCYMDDVQQNNTIENCVDTGFKNTGNNPPELFVAGVRFAYM